MVGGATGRRAKGERRTGGVHAVCGVVHRVNGKGPCGRSQMRARYIPIAEDGAKDGIRP